MATYDEDTKDFIKKVVGEHPETNRQLQRQALFATKSLLEEGPKKGIPNIAKGLAIGKAVHYLTDNEEKKASLTPTSVTPIEVLELLNNELDEGWDDFEPETIRVELAELLDIGAGPKLMNMIGALQTVLNTDYAFEMWHVFENVSHAFNENPVSFSVVQPAELDEIALTVRTLQKIRPEIEFEDDVCAYIAASAKNSGVVYLPPELYPAKAQMFLDNMNNNMELKEQVKSVWPNYRTGEGALAIQTQRLNEVRDYVRDKV